MTAPRLLDKKVVNAEVATQRKNLIDSGLTMAKKIDAVRETLQEETKNLDTFRTESVAIVQIEIDQKLNILDNIKRNIEERKQELVQLQIPLDQQWEEVNKAQAICNDWHTELDRREHNLEGRISIVEQSEKDIDVEKGRIAEMKRITVDKLNHAEDNLLRANVDASNIRSQAQNILASAELRVKVVTQKEDELQSTLVWIEKEKKHFASLDKDLTKREKVLKDRYETLERTLKRVK